MYILFFFAKENNSEITEEKWKHKSASFLNESHSQWTQNTNSKFNFDQLTLFLGPEIASMRGLLPVDWGKAVRFYP